MGPGNGLSGVASPFSDLCLGSSLLPAVTLPPVGLSRLSLMVGRQACGGMSGLLKLTLGPVDLSLNGSNFGIELLSYQLLLLVVVVNRVEGMLLTRFGKLDRGEAVGVIPERLFLGHQLGRFCRSRSV